MNIEEKINKIDKQIQELIIQKNELINQLTSNNLNNDSWNEIGYELVEDFCLFNEDEFLNEYISSTTETQSIFTKFLKSPKKYLVLKDFVKIPYEINTFGKIETNYVYGSLVLIKHWKKLTRKKTNTTITELKKFAQQQYFCFEKQNDNLKRLYYEIKNIQGEIEDILLTHNKLPEEIFNFKNPLSIHAQTLEMTYGKTREFIIVGLIVKPIRLP